MISTTRRAFNRSGMPYPTFSFGPASVWKLVADRNDRTSMGVSAVPKESWKITASTLLDPSHRVTLVGAVSRDERSSGTGTGTTSGCAHPIGCALFLPYRLVSWKFIDDLMCARPHEDP